MTLVADEGLTLVFNERLAELDDIEVLNFTFFGQYDSFGCLDSGRVKIGLACTGVQV